MTNEEQVIELETETSETKDVLEELTKEIEALKDKLLRSAAETENVRRRYEKQIEEVREYSSSSIAKDMMSVMDNLSRALSHKPTNADDSVKNFVLGVEMTQSELLSIFKKHAIEAIEPKIGDKFDYNLHNAIAQIESAEQQPSTIMDVMQIGYKIKDRLLRPASVSVSISVTK